MLLKKIEECFASYDANGDGTLNSSTELKLLLEDLNIVLEPDHVATLVQERDPARVGLNKQEFQIWWTTTLGDPDVVVDQLLALIEKTKLERQQRLAEERRRQQQQDPSTGAGRPAAASPGQRPARGSLPSVTENKEEEESGSSPSGSRRRKLLGRGFGKRISSRGFRRVLSKRVSSRAGGNQEDAS